ncbi:MAG: hypothetical protein AAB675_03545 [Patescibacteria group bacterium]
MSSIERVNVANIKENFLGTEIVRLHVAQYFKFQKNARERQAILEDYGLWFPNYDPTKTPLVVREKMWRDEVTDENGFIEFPPGVLVLGHTAENIEVPADIGLCMEGLFISESTGKILPLTTDVAAPSLHAGSKGPQTYEIINQSERALKVKVEDLVCIASVFHLGQPSVLAQENRDTTFGIQVSGKIKHGTKFF